MTIAGVARIERDGIKTTARVDHAALTEGAGRRLEAGHATIGRRHPARSAGIGAESKGGGARRDRYRGARARAARDVVGVMRVAGDALGGRTPTKPVADLI